MKKPWQKSENRWAGTLKGVQQPRSGGLISNKGDVRFRSFHLIVLKGLFENKSTTANSLRVEKHWLEKITDEALTVGAEPVFGFDINGERWLAVRESSIEEMYDD